MTTHPTPDNVLTALAAEFDRRGMALERDADTGTANLVIPVQGRDPIRATLIVSGGDASTPLQIAMVLGKLPATALGVHRDVAQHNYTHFRLGRLGVHTARGELVFHAVLRTARGVAIRTLTTELIHAQWLNLAFAARSMLAQLQARPRAERDTGR